MEKRYYASSVEPALQERWQEHGTYDFQVEDDGREIYSIDTPPPTVSGKLHLGHVYSYSHTDFMARYFRMQGFNVFYPMGFDDNGLPTEHLVERKLGQTAQEMGRSSFIKACLETSAAEEQIYEKLWRRLGLSIDWRYSYRTIENNSRKISQQSFLDLYHKGILYRQEAPIIWCPRCQTALAQADLVDIERESEFVTIGFDLVGGGQVQVATTRPELLPACVAVFFHPEDLRFKDLIGRKAKVPIFGREVPVLADPLADPEKGTGAVMCCTFGDQMDITWWHQYDLPLIEVVDTQGRMTAVAGDLAGLTVKNARREIKKVLEEQGYLLDQTSTMQVIRAHDRDDVPIEYLTTQQWFIRILHKKDVWLKLGESLNWYPEYMQNRYSSWVENLKWDWCISRQRYYGVPIPIWYCTDCGNVLLPSSERLPIDPLSDTPDSPCQECGSSNYEAEKDVLDTWATSSLSPQIVSRWLSDNQLFTWVFPMTLRPQAHEIIRTWTFYTIIKSYFQFNTLPWRNVLISGWGIAGEGMGKISKSKGGGPMPPMEMLEKYSADAVRYWAASTGIGKDAVISEAKVKIGQKLVTKLWNLARFNARFINGHNERPDWEALTGGDRWILSKLGDLIEVVTSSMEGYDYSYAKSETEKFMWIFADNYLEMAKGRLYSDNQVLRDAAQFTLSKVLLTIIKLFAPFLPHVTEQIYFSLFREKEDSPSIHQSLWPKKEINYYDHAYIPFGEYLIDIATTIRRFKSDNGLSLGTVIEEMQLKSVEPEKFGLFKAALPDLMCVTRAEKVTLVQDFGRTFTVLPTGTTPVQVAIKIPLEE